ncbi:E3 ubiquitin-protein ligase RZFP34 [Camellia lanceoleosa]|uniref:E3 ubiquitin-protein ligase RZFP34 n=1 Tax=Camellia lanceoleosa TaxID=1840588 RepID=A0ACC0HHP8_9ERIC|nr:E3 ubiquitin-protein ligase RZFP34 [Camellia lanceoleosa]
MESGLDPQMSNTSHGSEDESLMEMGSGSFGCSHYRRRCKIRAPCCDEIFDCRHYHNESKNSLEVNPLNRHDISRHELKRDGGTTIHQTVYFPRVGLHCRIIGEKGECYFMSMLWRRGTAAALAPLRSFISAGLFSSH